MDLDKVRAGLQDIENEQQATETPAEQPSLWDRLKNLPGEIVNAMGQESVVTSQGNLAAAQETSEMASHAANDAAQAVSNLGQNWQDFLHRGAELQAAYSPEAVQQANETGDYSAQSEAVYNAEDAGQAVTDSIRDLALSPVRYEAGKYINQYADAEGDDNQKWAQALERSNAGLEYFLTDADKLAKARDIEADTGIPAEAFLGDTKAFRQALDIYHYKQKVDAAGGDINDVWQKFPELQDVANMDAKAAALALHNLDNIRETRGIVDTFTHALEAGNKELEYHNLQWKILTGEATDNDKERAADLKASIENDRKELPTVIEDPVAAMVAGIAQSAPEMWQSMVEGARDASVAATAAMLAGAALGSAAGPLGTAGGALAGLTGGAATGFARSLIADATRRQLVTAAIQAGIQTGMFAGMWRPETGQRYADYKEMKDENGNPLLTDNQARGWAALGGAANAGIELANFGIITKALAGAPHAKRVFGDIIEQFGAGLTAREAFSNMLKDRAADIAKVTLSESGEEGLQSISDDLIHNQIEYSTGDTSNKVYSFGDIAGHAFMAFAQSLPSSLGFGLIGAGGGMVTRGIGITSGMRNRASFEARYGENARKTVTGTLMVERLQQAISQNDMKEKAPDVQRTILRGELKNTGYENSYIDTEIALEQEHGLDDLKKVAKAANISNEDLQTAIEEKGTIMVPTEQYAQSAASPELLQAVSYSQEADSIGRMHKDAKAVMEQVQTMQKKAVERQVDTVLNVINQYFPSEEEAKNDPQKAQVRDLATAAVFANPENPAQGWNAYRKEMQDKLDAILAPAMQALQDGMGKGGQILKTEDERGNETYVRATENAEWYRNFYKAFHRAPTKEELTQMAIALTTGDASAPKVAGFIPETEEEQQAMAEGKKEINYLQQAIATLDKIKPTMRKLNGVEMKLTEGLSPEAFSVYRTVSDQLKAFGGMPARAARVSAILTARHADIVAKLISEKTGKKYTALDYLRERYGFDAEGKYLDNGLHQNAGERAEVQLGKDEAKWQRLADDYQKADKEKWKKQNNGKLYDFMNIPLVLQILGVPFDTIKAYGSFFKHSLDSSKHVGMNLDLIKKLPRQMTDPIMITRGNKPNSYVFVLPIKTSTGATIIAPVEVSKLDKSSGAVVNVINSAFGKEHNGKPMLSWFEKQIQGNEILYLNTKKSMTWIEAYRNDNPAVLRLGDALSDFILSDKAKEVKTEDDLVKARNANPSMYQMAGYYGAKKLSSVLMDKLSEAQTMKQNGKDNQTVWDKTGWFEGTDGKWRFEIPDHLDKINLGAMQGGTTLGAVYDNPLLYRAYPWLKDIKVSFVNANKSEYSGAVVKGAHDEEIHLNTNASKEELKSILVHEVQHVIQREEGFTPGGNVKSARAAIDNMQEGALKQKLQARSDGYVGCTVFQYIGESFACGEDCHQLLYDIHGCCLSQSGQRSRCYRQLRFVRCSRRFRWPAARPQERAKEQHGKNKGAIFLCWSRIIMQILACTP